MSSNYNSRVKPAEILVLDGEPHLISRPQTIDDLLANQVDVSHIFAEAAIENLKPKI
jgi:diaminopimelate decarboxylase